MKQVHSGPTPPLLVDRGRWWPLVAGFPRPMGPARRRSAIGTGGVAAGLLVATWRVAMATLGLAWFVIAMPFRLAFWAIAWLGRLTGLAIGFALMVAGAFFLAGPFFLIGIPLFLFGLVLTLRCLD